MIGKCLCESVQFEVVGKLPKLYQCHCSQCRRQNGATSNTATLVREENFRWLSGQDNISKWRHSSGFRSSFCATCGCPAPKPLGNQSYVWIPVGLLEKSGHSEIAAHLFVDSRADWEKRPSSGAVFDTMPGLAEFIALLHD